MQRLGSPSCQRHMPALRILLFVTVLSSIYAVGCRKDSERSDPVLVGTWAKGPNFYDTLRFYRQGGKDLVSYSLSFNPAFAAPSEFEYKYQDGKLSIRMFNGNEFWDIDSFQWKQVGKEFTVQGIQLFPFMSSTMSYFTYHKIE